MRDNLDPDQFRASRPLRILMLSWDFPPAGTGLPGRRVHRLAAALVAAGHEVTVVTRHAAGCPPRECRDGVRVVRAAADPPLFPLTGAATPAATVAVNHALTRAGLRAAGSAAVDLVHAQDDLVTHAAVTLKEHLDRPLVATMHATVAGRCQARPPDELSGCVQPIGYWLGREAARVLVPSGYLGGEVARLLDVPAAKIEVVPGGVDPGAYRATPNAVAAARWRYAGAGPLIGYVGRLVPEKGVRDLVAALPALRAAHPGLRAVVAGDGPYRQHVQEQVRALRLHRAISFTGHLAEADLPALLGALDALVVPGAEEPFGTVALEAAAAGTPVAVAASGGLTEIVEPGVTGVTFAARDPAALAAAVAGPLDDPDRASGLAAAARRTVADRYGWATVARRTVEAYATALRQAPAFHPDGAPPVAVPKVNLLAAP